MTIVNCLNCGLKNIDPILKECSECTSVNLEKLELIDVNHHVIIESNSEDASLVCSSCSTSRFTEARDGFIRCNKCGKSLTDFKKDLTTLIRFDLCIESYEYFRRRGMSDAEAKECLIRQEKREKGISMKEFRNSIRNN